MKIVYFAWVREKAGVGEEEVTLPADVSDVAGLIDWIKARGSGFADAFADLEMVRTAVNQEYVTLDHPVRPGDEIAFFPPMTGDEPLIRVQREDFDVGAEMARLTEGNVGVGGVCAFVGLVRDMAGGSAVGAMTLEHYPGMTEKELARVEAEARGRWDLEASLVIHRYGRLEPGERIVLVVTAARHREAAFDACRFLIDWLKTRAPLWKREEGAEGDRWVDARASDDASAERWVRDKAAE